MSKGQIITVATANSHKLSEIESLFGPDWVLLPPPAGMEFPPENGNSYLENAIIKARAVASHVKGWVLGDDSGLEVDALGGLPGIISARFSGPSATSLENCHALLKELKGVENRTARFRAVLVLVEGGSGKILATSEGVIEGRLTKGLLGEGGFGYDPLFIPENYQVTFGILPESVKNAISHRARAVSALIPKLEALSGGGL
jgi:XTP/dITP diphosphohydrolase